MADYKNTLNLPKTDFPMKANLQNREPQMLKHWQNIDIYQKICKVGEGRPTFIMHDGPPYANGTLHIGHAVNKTLKDIVMKSKRLSGFHAPYVPGWDCHGLPIELNVEKKTGKPGGRVSYEDFRIACRKYADSQVDIQRESFKSLGIFGDWDNPYKTMNFKYEAGIIRSLAKIIENGYVHKGYKPVHWCIDCSSALAEAEVEYKDKHSPAIDVRFSVLDETVFLSRCDHCEDLDKQGHGPISVPIWTTTPWTLPANQAVSIHPEKEYALVQCETSGGDERLLVAEALLKDVMDRYRCDRYHVVAYCAGSALEGIKLAHPFYDREVPIVLGEHVTVEAGTGCVHTAPAHGVDDYQMGLKYNLPMENPVTSNGCYIESVAMFGGQHVMRAGEGIIEVLRTKNKLIHMEAIDHSYPHCWRHKTPLILRATPQWFISMEANDLRKKVLSEIDKVDWIPDWGKARITAMMETRPDWCISRQRTWCVPMALFVHKETNEMHPFTPAIMEKVAKRVEEVGIEAWHQLEAKDVIEKNPEQFEKVADTLDVWFDSGVTHACVLDEREGLSSPADLYLEGSDQHRGWFNSSMLTSIAIHGRAPYKAVLTHGFTVDEKGHKMSKSIGNIISIEKAQKTIGLDVLRLWIAATEYRTDLAFSDEIFKRASDTYRRLRNTARFLLANLNGFDVSEHLVAHEKMLAVDQYAMAKALEVQLQIQQDYDRYQFHLVVQRIHHFCAVDMGSFYLDVIKDRQYTCQENSVARRSAQTAMFHVLHALVRWMAPIISFTADEIWRYIPDEDGESVFLTTWYESLAEIDPSAALTFSDWQALMNIRDVVNKEIENKRKQGVIGSALNTDLTLYCGPSQEQLLNKFGDELHFVFITSTANVQPLCARDASAVETEDSELWLQVKASSDDKCERCWHHCQSVGQSSAHPTLCARCEINVDGDGEVRQFI